VAHHRKGGKYKGKPVDRRNPEEESEPEILSNPKTRSELGMPRNPVRLSEPT